MLTTRVSRPGVTKKTAAGARPPSPYADAGLRDSACPGAAAGDGQEAKITVERTALAYLAPVANRLSGVMAVSDLSSEYLFVLTPTRAATSA